MRSRFGYRLGWDAGDGSGSLLTDLISYWKMDEAAAASRADSVVASANDLSVNGTVAQAAGKIVNAAGYAGPVTDFLAINSNASLQTGDVSFMLQFWVRPDPISALIRFALKGPASPELEWAAAITAAGVLQFSVSTNGTALGVSISSDEALVESDFNHILCWHDAGANQIGVSVNGVEKTAAHAGGVRAGTGALRIGAIANGDEIPLRVDEVGFWKGSVPSAAMRAQLYGGGAGLAYPFS